jgi:hypothetical protein
MVMAMVFFKEEQEHVMIVTTTIIGFVVFVTPQKSEAYFILVR